MTGSEEPRREAGQGWEHVGRAAEDFARRVARDAARFAERLQEHTSEFADDVARDWRRSRHRHRRRYEAACGSASADDVRRVFDDVRGVVADVLDGIDELIGRVFQAPRREEASEWQKVVSNRDVSCTTCNRAVAVGEEAYVRKTDGGVEYRCQSCATGAANPSPEPRVSSPE